jgi:sialic acid synthase SpsE
MSVLIIAEAGVAHCGVLDNALRLCDEAKKAGADVVKFQTFLPEECLHRGPRYDMLAQLALSFGEFRKIAHHCEEVGIEFCSTPDDVESLWFLVHECGVRRIKIGSGSLLHRPLISAAVKPGLPVLLSTGMATMDDIWRVLSWFPQVGMYPAISDESALMHCVSLYPCPAHLANLTAIQTMAKETGLSVGWSDHTTSVAAIPCAAVALGATVIEKHLSLPPPDQGIDYECSLDPQQFGAMVRAIREAELALGDGVKAPSPEEAAKIPLLRKSADGRQPTEEIA